MKRPCLVFSIVVFIGLLLMPISAQAGEIVYSNTTTFSGQGFVGPVGDEIGDELFMTGGGILDSVSFSVLNSKYSDSSVATADITVKFYNPDDYTTPEGSLFFDDYTLNLEPIHYTTASFTGISSQQTINLASTILATLTFGDLKDSTGAPITGDVQLGQVFFGPPTVGSSEDNYYRNGQWSSFNGHPVANFYWEVDIIPEPASLLLLGSGLGILWLAAWRRKK